MNDLYTHGPDQLQVWFIIVSAGILSDTSGKEVIKAGLVVYIIIVMIRIIISVLVMFYCNYHELAI